MAPSRALLVRRITSAIAQPQIRPTTRILSATAGIKSCSRNISCFKAGPSRHSIFPALSRRPYSQEASSTPEPPDYLNEAELHIFNKIKKELEPVKLEVQDTSGGCGSMYAISIESPKFAGMTPIKQARLVNQVLKEEIATWHGIQLRTKAA